MQTCRGPLRLNVPSREAQQGSAVYQEMGVEHEGGRGIPSLEQAEEMLARHPGAMMAAMAQVAMLERKTQSRRRALKVPQNAYVYAYIQVFCFIAGIDASEILKGHLHPTRPAEKQWRGCARSRSRQ